MSDKKIDFTHISATLVRYKYVIVVIVVGFFLLLLPKSAKDADLRVQENLSFDVNKFEKELENALSACDGIGRVKVLLSVKSGTENVYASEKSESVRENEKGIVEENDSDMKPSVLTLGSGKQSPIIIKELYPEFRGALIICDGAENTDVERNVISSVSAVTGLSSDKISVIKMKK